MIVLDPTSTCDPFIDEHFRRSLGNDYDLIINKNKVNMEQEIQKQRMLEEQKRVSAEQTLQDQHLLKLKHHNYKKHQIHQHQALMAAAAVAASMTPQIKVATPPPSTPLIQLSVVAEPTQKQVIITENNEDESNELSVDDHFAKALGENWQKKFHKEG